MASYPQNTAKRPLNQVTLRHVSEEVRSRREELHLTQEAAARIAGFSTSTWANIERGSTVPSLSTARGVAQALRWEVGFIEALASGEAPKVLDVDALRADLALIAEWNAIAFESIRSLVAELASVARSTS